MILDLSEVSKLSGYIIGLKRALCIDYGDTRIGLAISDLEWKIASPLKVIKSRGVFQELFDIIVTHSVGIVIVGVPVSLGGDRAGMQYEKVQKFVNKLNELAKRGGINISSVFWDERFSTVAASRFLEESVLSRQKRNQHIDKVAASFILHGFLEYIHQAIQIAVRGGPRASC
ncbi:MAG: Holliday junction resolvase RuvX [Holosporales bacterium]|jgi:putative Holliday junction resolvase|nr:Holliday junction resolvase RuvX [Holosporales bacterium]